MGDEAPQAPEYHSNSKRPVRETVVAAISFLLVFTSFHSLQNLQSSLHQQQGLGVASLAALYASAVPVSFITPAIVYNLGVKNTLLLSWLANCVYVACNFYPSWLTLIPGSVLLGCVQCPCWIALYIYLSALARCAVDLDREKTPLVPTTLHAAYSRLLGLFNCIYLTSNLIGNLVSSSILFQSSYNMTLVTSSSLTSECGVEHCPQTGKGDVTAPPESAIGYVMLGVFLALDLAGIAVAWCILADLERPHYKGREILIKLRSYFEGFSHPKLVLLLPLFVSRGINVSLHVGLFTEAFVSCTLGIRMVGYVMAVWGLTAVTVAGLLGYTARFTGRYCLFAIGFMCEAIFLMTLLWWRPHSDSLAVLMCLAAMMGVVDGIFRVQISALLAVLFEATQDCAYSVRATWSSLALAVSFLLTIFLCPRNRIYIALGTLGVALLGYGAAEVVHRSSPSSGGRRNEEEYIVIKDATK